MFLFSKEKEIILKITNAILLIWAIAAVVFVASSIIELTLKEPVRKYTYEEYKLNNCTSEALPTTSDADEKLCLSMYEDYKYNLNSQDFYNWKTLYISIANVVIVGGVIFFLNKEKKTKK